ncbi:MAG: choice-of-anchor tandem repeat GloVer-containing protein, partial [Rhizomicrobium sp.]
MTRLPVCLLAIVLSWACQLHAAVAWAATERVVHSFKDSPDGAYPAADLIDVGGTLYGTTVEGGANCEAYDGCGTVFSLDPATGAETVLYSFCSQQNCTDGEDPGASLIDVGGKLYGTTVHGGRDDCFESNGCGTVFSLDLATGAETVPYSFCSQQNCTDGEYPEASLIDVGGKLYGTTGDGGRYGCFERFGCGTVFSLDPKTRTEKVLYAFCSQENCTDGALPAGLIDVKGMLYGTTDRGGANCEGEGHGDYGCGTAFAVDLKTGVETVL